MYCFALQVGRREGGAGRDVLFADLKGFRVLGAKEGALTSS